MKALDALILCELSQQLISKPMIGRAEDVYPSNPFKRFSFSLAPLAGLEVKFPLCLS